MTKRATFAIFFGKRNAKLHHFIEKVMKLHEFLRGNEEILTNLNKCGYKDGDLYRLKVYDKFCEMLPTCGSVKATLLTMEQQGYGSVATIKRIRKRMEQDID